MNQLQRYHGINEYELKQDFYFQSLFEALCVKNLISQSEMEQIQFGLIELMGKEVDRYTNWESSSIPVEKAQELLRSVSYCIGVYLKSISDMGEKIDTLKQENLVVLFHRGMDKISKIKQEAFELLQWNQKHFLKVDHIAYYDTVFEGIPKFFHDYNIEYSSNEIPGSIDYQLLYWVDGLIGVEFIHEYLRRLKLENNFLLNFSEYEIGRLMKAFHKDAQHMLVNLFELVLTNALACAMVGINVSQLVLGANDFDYLEHKLSNCDETSIHKLVIHALLQLKDKLPMEEETFGYAQKSLRDLTTRITVNIKNQTLNQLFLCVNEAPEMVAYFENGTPMEDEALRELIEEINNIPLIPEKLNRIRQGIASMEDWEEIINECFYQEELQELFLLFTKNEKAILLNKLKEEAGLELPSEFLYDQEWKKLFLMQGE